MAKKNSSKNSAPTQVEKKRPLLIFLTYILIPVLILIILLLPPISLVDRLMSIGYQAVGPEGGVLQLADGAQVEVEGISNSAWIKLDAVPASSFLEGTAGDSLVAAADNIPAGLTLKSPFYQIQHRGDSPNMAAVTVPISKNDEPRYTLDLYSWNGEVWEWLPSRHLPAQNAIKSHLDFLPQSVAVMQTTVDKTALAPNLAVEFNPQGFILNEEGQISERVETQSADVPVIPNLRNWDGDTVNSIATKIILLDTATRANHVDAVVELVQSNNYPGINLDYRGIDPDLRERFTTFVTELRAALPDDKQLSVQVALPRGQSANSWDTGAYNWQAIGRVADWVKLPTPPDPKAYAAAGDMESMLDWAVGQVNRRKLQLLLRPDSAEAVDGAVRDLDYRQALEQVGNVAAVGAPDMVNPGETVNFTLAGLQSSTGVQIDDANTYWFAYLDEDNRHHTVYLKNAANLERAVQFVPRYRLGGVAVQSSAGDEQMLEIMQGLFEQSASPVDSEYSIAWRVEGPHSSLPDEELVDLSDPGFSWTAPESGGVFEVAANISSNQNPEAVSRGSVAVQVATPTPTLTPTPTPTPSPTPTLTPTPSPTFTPSPTPKPTSTPTFTPTPKAAQPAAAAQPKQPAAPPPPAVAPVNVPFGYGIQADPRGDTAANIGHIRSLGFEWVKFQMAWKDVESQPGDFSWAMWDQIIDAYSANGIKVLLSIPKSPDWARPFDDDKSVEGPPQDSAIYADFVGNVAGRYRGRVQAIEIWNEQNLWYEAGGVGRINAAAYVQLLQQSYRTVKAANPEMIVVSGALTPAGNVGEFAVDDVEYLTQMYANGAKGYFDALGAHPSGYNCPAGGDWRTVQDPTAMSFRGTFDNRHHSWCFRGTMESYREVMVANGDGDKAIIPTEFGWAVSGNPQPGYEYARDNTPEEQARWIVEAYQIAKEWGWVGPMFLWNLDYGVTASGTELANFGILNTPAFPALAGMPK